jgi:hypothetical protein
VWRHDGASISEFALVLGGLVISAKGKFCKVVNLAQEREVKKVARVE